MSKQPRDTIADSPRLSAEDRETIAQATSELVAIQVYRELQAQNELAKVAGCSIIGNCSNGSCDIIGNCSSSSKDAILRALTTGSGR